MTTTIPMRDYLAAHADEHRITDPLRAAEASAALLRDRYQRISDQLGALEPRSPPDLLLSRQLEADLYAVAEQLDPLEATIRDLRAKREADRRADYLRTARDAADHYAKLAPVAEAALRNAIRSLVELRAASHDVLAALHGGEQADAYTRALNPNYTVRFVENLLKASDIQFPATGLQSFAEGTSPEDSAHLLTLYLAGLS